MAFRQQQDTIEGLTAKCNRLVARIQDLDRENHEKEVEWTALLSNYKTTETLARELCELILAKDPNEMVLGAEYSWKKKDTKSLIDRSKQVFADYNKNRTALLKDIQAQSENRREQIERLSDQISQQCEEIKQLSSLHGDRHSTITDTHICEEDTGKVSDKAKGRMPYDMQKSAENGDIDIHSYNENNTDIETNTTISDKPPVVEPVVIIEEETSDKDIVQIADIKLSKAAKKIKPSARKEAVINVSQHHDLPQDFISDIEGKITPRAWSVIEAIGTTGYFDITEIISKTQEIIKIKHIDGETITDAATKYELKTLCAADIITKEDLNSNPIKPNYSVYSLSEKGKILFTKKFGYPPVLSELQSLVSQHDNIDHGIGIKALKEVLEKSGQFSMVSMDRKENTYTLNDGTKYIPDITAHTIGRMGKGGYDMYFEYERGTHHQSDFNLKMNKAVKKSRFINIVCPNNNTVERVKNEVAKWVESRGNGKTIPNVKVRITTARYLNQGDKIIQDDNWKIIFDMSKNPLNPIEKIPKE